MNQYVLLWEYQQADVLADNMQRNIARSPQRLKLLQLRDDIKGQQEFLKTLENEVIAMIDRLDILQDAIGLSDTQLKQLQKKTREEPPADSQAAKDYIEEVQKLIQGITEYEQETRRIRKEASEREKKQRNIKLQAVRIKTEFDALRDEYNVEYQANSEELKKLRNTADEKAKGIDQKMMDKYMAIKQHSVPPIAKLQNDRCGGCNMSFPSSVLHDIKNGKEIECETCGRMIII